MFTALKQRRRRKQNVRDEKTKNLNQQTTVLDEKSNHEELISSAEVHNDRHENNRQQQSIDADQQNEPDEIIRLDEDDDADKVIEQQQNRISSKHDPNESTIRTEQQQQTSYCWPSRSSKNINHDQTNQPKNIDSTLSSLSFSLSSLLESVSTKQNQTILDPVEPTSLETTILIIMKPIRECLAIIKRCLNRLMRNGSHYGAYNLSTTTTHDNFFVNFDDYDDDGQQVEASCIDDHKWRNKHNNQTLTDYRCVQQEVSITV